MQRQRRRRAGWGAQTCGRLVCVCVCVRVCVCSASYACLTCAGEEAVCVIFIVLFQEQTEPIHVPSST